MLPPSFDPPPYILAILQSKKRGVNTNPHTHNIENFHCGPSNLNDLSLKSSIQRTCSMSILGSLFYRIRRLGKMTPPRELCPSVSSSGLVELNTREFLGHTHNDIPRLGGLLCESSVELRPSCSYL